MLVGHCLENSLLEEKKTIPKKKYVCCMHEGASPTFLGRILVWLENNSRQLVSSKAQNKTEELSNPWLASEPRSDVTCVKAGQPNVQRCGTAQAPAHKHLC